MWTPTEDQKAALELIATTLGTRTGKTRTLIKVLGNAGSGKSVLITMLLSDRFTHKVRKIIDFMGTGAPYVVPNLVVPTHAARSMLNRTLDNVSTNPNERLPQARMYHSTYGHPSQFVIIDEASMVPVSEFAQVQLKGQKGFVIAVGDPEQLQSPTGEPSLLACTPDDPGPFHEVVEVHLPTVQRQSADSGILSESLKYRDRIVNGGAFEYPKANDHIIYGDQSQVFRALESGKLGTVLTYTNKAADQLRQSYRAHLSGKPVGSRIPPLPQETYRVRSVPLPWGTIKSLNTILSMSPETVIRPAANSDSFANKFRDEFIHRLNSQARHELVSQAELDGVIKALRDADIFRIDGVMINGRRLGVPYNVVTRLVKLVNQLPTALRTPLLQHCVPVSPTQIMTTHSAQGATHENVAIAAYDFVWAGKKNPDLANRLMYTALTRAKNKVIIMGG